MGVISDVDASKNAKVLMVTVIRDSAHYIKDWIEYHTRIGVDSFVFNHHFHSTDGTLELLRAYANTHRNITVIEQPEKQFVQWEYMTRVIHEGVKLYNPKYVISCDVDEFAYTEDVDLFKSLNDFFEREALSENTAYAYLCPRYNMASTVYDISSTEHFSKQIAKSPVHGKTVFRRPGCGWSGLHLKLTHKGHVHEFDTYLNDRFEYLTVGGGPEMFHFPNWLYEPFARLKLDYASDYPFGDRYDHLRIDEAPSDAQLKEYFYTEVRNILLASKHVDRRFMKRYSTLFGTPMDHALPDSEDFSPSDILRAFGLSIESLPDDFDAATYVLVNPDLKGFVCMGGDVCAMYHYLKHGIDEGRAYHE